MRYLVSKWYDKLKLVIETKSWHCSKLLADTPVVKFTKTLSVEAERSV